MAPVAPTGPRLPRTFHLSEYSPARHPSEARTIRISPVLLVTHDLMVPRPLPASATVAMPAISSRASSGTPIHRPRLELR